MTGHIPADDASSFDTTKDDSLRDVLSNRLVIEQLSIVRMPRLVEIYYVSGAELDALALGYSSTHLAFLGIVIGASVTLLVTVATVKMSDRQYATFTTLAITSVFAAIYFGIRAFIDLRRQARHVADIKRNRSQTTA